MPEGVFLAVVPRVGEDVAAPGRPGARRPPPTALLRSRQQWATMSNVEQGGLFAPRPLRQGRHRGIPWTSSNPPVMTVDEVAVYLRIPRGSVYKLPQRGNILVQKQTVFGNRERSVPEGHSAPPGRNDSGSQLP